MVPVLKYIRLRPCPQVQSRHLVPVCRPFLLVLGKFTTLYLLLKSCFKMASDRAKWSNYVHGYISGTQGVNPTAFCASTQPQVRGHQVWKASQRTDSVAVYSRVLAGVERV